MKTKEEFQKLSEVLVEPINTFIAENEWQWDLPIKTLVGYRNDKVVVELRYHTDTVGWIGWETDTIEEMKSQIMHDTLQILEF